MVPDLPRPYATGREGSYKMQIPINTSANYEKQKEG